MRLGEILIERRLLNQDDLDRALELQRERGDKLGKILVDLGFVAHREVLNALSTQLNVPLITLDGPPASSPEIEALSPRFLRQFRCIPVAQHDHTVTLAMADPLDFETRASVASCTGLTVEPALASEQEILDAIERYYGQSSKNETEAVIPASESEDLEHLRDMASEAPVIRLVNALIAVAAEKRASDIHIEPFEKEFRVRYRIDGVLVNQDSPPREMKAAIISRVKLMARLNIAERRLPQDGRIKVKTLGREVDLRVSTLPTLYGESVVMRLLDRLGGRFLRSGEAGVRCSHAAADGVLTLRCRMAFFWSLVLLAAVNRPRCIRRSSGSTSPTKRSLRSKIRWSIKSTGSIRST